MNAALPSRARTQPRRRGLRRAVAVLVCALLGAGTLGAVAPTAQAAAAAAPDHLVISAVFGSDGGAYNSDWVQLYNPTDSDISLGTINGSTVTPSYYQCYRSLTGTSCSSMKLYGTVRAHHYFLIWDGHNAAAGTDRGTTPAGVTPDLNFALDAGDTAGTSKDPSGQSNNGFGGYSTGGQILLLNAASAGVYTGTGDLASAAARSAGVVDAVSWTKYAAPTYTQPGSAETAGATAVTGASAGPSNAYVSARAFVNGVPQDTDKNAADFSAVTTADFTLHSQVSDHVAVAPVPDTEISRGEAMAPLQVQGSKGTGTLTYAATGLPTGVTIDGATGAVSGTPGAAVELKGYPVTVTVSDQSPTGPETATTSFTLTVSSALRVDPIADVPVRKGAALTPIQVSAHGGTPDYTYAATGLPAGIAIDPASGVISGTPTDAVGRYRVHVTAKDSGAVAKTASADFAILERPTTTPPSGTDPLAGLRINEVRASGTPAGDFVELLNTGAAVTGASVSLVDGAGDAYRVPTQDVAAGGFVVVEGAALHAAGLDLAASDTLDLVETDGTVLDESAWTAYRPTSWARFPDGTGAFATSTQATKGAANAVPDTVATDHLVIAAVFGANGDAVRWSNDWVELYNPTDSPISLGSIDTTTTPNATVTPNYALCYRSYNATGACSSLVQLYGTVAPHHHFFIWYANAHSPADHGTFPAGLTPDLDASVKTPANGNQSGSNMGGCNTGGQIALLDTSKGTAAINGDLSSPAARAAGAVDGVGWMNASTNQPVSAESKGAGKVTGVDSGTNNTCVIARTFLQGYAVDTDVNSSDFAPVTDLASFTTHTQNGDRVVIPPVADAEISLNMAMDPIRVKATAVVGALSWSASGLPAGVTIDPSTGVTSGTPTTSGDLGAHQVTVTVADGWPSDTASTTFTLTLSKTLRVDPIADVSSPRGSALTAVQVRTHGGIAPYAYAATGLPTGVTIDPSTGVISGTPTAAIGHYAVHVTVDDGGVGDAHSTVARDFTVVVLPPTAGPAAGDPLAGLRINEIKASATPASNWVEVYNTGAATASVPLALVDSEGDTVQLPARAIPAHGYAVLDGIALATGDTLYLTEADGTLLDQTTWTAYQPTSWARTTDGAGTFATSAYPTKGAANPGAPVIKPNDLLVSEVNYDNNSTDYYEYSEITNTTDHPIDFAAYDLTLTKSGVAMTLHDPSDTSQASPVVDPVIPAHATQLVWWVENQYFGVKTTAQFLSNYGLPAATPVVLAYGFTSMANSGGDHTFYISVNQGGSTLVSRAYVDTPCAAGTINGASVCPATNNNYAEHYAVPSDRTNADAAVWYNSLAAGGDDVNSVLKARLSTPTTVDLEQVGATRAVKITSVSSAAVVLHDTATAPVDLSGYVLQKNSAGATFALPAGTTITPGADLTVTSGTSGLSFADRDYVTLLAPRGYAYSDGLGIADTTGPLLKTLPYDASSGQEAVIDPTTGLPLPPAGGLYRPGGISARDGKVYVSNTGDNLVATIANGTNTIVAGSLEGYGEVGNEGPAVDAQLYQPGGVAEDAQGNVYIADSGDNVVRKITTDGVIHRFAGTGVAGGPATVVTASSTPLSVSLWHPNDVVVDGAGNVFIADTSDNRVLEVTAAGAVKVVAGTGKAGYSGDGAAGSAARLSQPAGIAVDAKDNVYVADSSNNVVRRVDAATGVITTVAGDYAAGLAKNSCLGGFAGDGGPATSALLNDPQGVALDTAGDLFIADTFNHAVRQVAPDGTISTLVNAAAVPGAGNASPVGNGAVPSTTKLNTPYAVAVDPVTNLIYVADTKNNAVDEVLNAARGGSAAGPLEPADKIAVTGSGQAGSACAVLANGPVTSASAPSVTGTRTVGATLTADPGTWTPVADSYSYQWLRDGSPITGATQRTYAATAEDGGHLLAVAVTAVKEEFASSSATSAAVTIAPQVTTPAGPGTLTTATPTITGPVKVGVAVTAAPGPWTAGAGAVTSFGYQWLRNGIAIPGATAPTYAVTTDDFGGSLSVAVTGTHAGYAAAAATSAAYPVVAGTLTKVKPRLRGAARVGHELTAKAGRWKAGPVKLTGKHLTYRWYADGQRISGAHRASYVVAARYRGARITVEVTGTWTGYDPVTVSSKHTAAVTAR